MKSNFIQKTVAGVVVGAAMSVFFAAAIAADVEGQANAVDVAASDAGLAGAHDFQWMCQQYLEIMSTSAS